MGLRALFNWVQREAPGTGPNNHMLAAYQRSQAPPRVCIEGPGRVYLSDFAPMEMGFIQLGNGAMIQPVAASALGISWTPELTQLTERQTVIGG